MHTRLTAGKTRPVKGFTGNAIGRLHPRPGGEMQGQCKKAEAGVHSSCATEKEEALPVHGGFSSSACMLMDTMSSCLML